MGYFRYSITDTDLQADNYVNHDPTGDEPAPSFSLSDLNSARRYFTIPPNFTIYYGLIFIR
jgi:hypothetical protein